tara:strand:- start:159 stop:629 length:471 start_codon:yes stop_codon:yes gene_type:complete
MANISTYPVGTPAQGDLIPGTQKYTDANGKTENLTRNFTVAQLAAFANSYSLGYTVYTALVTQVSTGAPTAVVLQNTTGGTITWSRTSAGSYVAVISGANYVANKTTILLGNTNASMSIASTYKTTTNVTFEQKSISNNANADGFDNVTVEIRIYS